MQICAKMSDLCYLQKPRLSYRVNKFDSPGKRDQNSKKPPINMN